MSNIFVQELKAAHAVFTAHKRGADNITELTKRTGLRGDVCAEWCKNFGLRLHKGLAQEDFFKMKEMMGASEPHDLDFNGSEA